MLTQPSTGMALAGGRLAATLLLGPRDDAGRGPRHAREHDLEELADLWY